MKKEKEKKKKRGSFKIEATLIVKEGEWFENGACLRDDGETHKR
jgi:hypothetical protein